MLRKRVKRFGNQNHSKIFQLISRAEDPEIRAYVEELTFVIVPCLNPDGYEFTRSSSNPHVSELEIHQDDNPL